MSCIQRGSNLAVDGSIRVPREITLLVGIPLHRVAGGRGGIFGILLLPCARIAPCMEYLGCTEIEEARSTEYLGASPSGGWTAYHKESNQSDLGCSGRRSIPAGRSDRRKGSQTTVI